MKFVTRTVSVLLLLAVMLSLVPGATSTASAATCNWAQFIADVTIPDGTNFAANTAFKKTWRLKNIGTCAWNSSDVSLVFDSGERMNAPASLALPTTVNPGQTVDITVDMTSPATAGHYFGYWKFKSNTGGTFGIQNIKRPELFGFSFEGNVTFFYFVLLITVVAGVVLALLLRSPWGRAFAALRDNPIRAESTGVNITAYTLMSFAIGAAYAGIAGALFAPLVNFIEPAPFGIANSLLFLMMVVVGGSGRFYGPVLGAAIALLLPEYLRFLKDWYLAVFGFAAVAMMIWLPGGLLSIREQWLLAKAKREAKRQATPSGAEAA